jgi:hypothetical protein
VDTHPPYALVAPEFRFRALAALAGRAALGGSRELLLATLLGGRLADGVVGPHPLPAAQRRTRAAAARSWLAAVAMTATARNAVGRVIESTATDDRRALGDAWDGLLALVTPYLDVAARSEVRRIALAAHGPPA